MLKKFKFELWEYKNRKVRSNEALESRKVKQEVDVQNSPATKFLTNLIGYPPGIKEYQEFKKQITKLNPDLKPSSHCRRIPGLTKWTEQNLDRIIPLTNYIDAVAIKLSPKLQRRTIKLKSKRNKKKSPLISQNNLQTTYNGMIQSQNQPMNSLNTPYSFPQNQPGFTQPANSLNVPYSFPQNQPGFEQSINSLNAPYSFPQNQPGFTQPANSLNAPYSFSQNQPGIEQSDFIFEPINWDENTGNQDNDDENNEVNEMPICIDLSEIDEYAPINFNESYFI